MTEPIALSTPLDGIKVIDLTSVLYGPYATQMLADLGADVIKIESPEGDPTRNLGPRKNEKMAAGFLGTNRNKRSVVLDLKKPAAQQALWQLIDSADMFVHNIRPQKIEKLGFSPSAVMKRNENIVYGSFHGYLEAGPYGGRPAYDDVIQGQSGVAATFLLRDGTPAYAPGVIADKSSGLIAATALTAALFQRLRRNHGVYVEIGMFESMVAYTLLEHQFGLMFSPAKDSGGYSRVISAERKPFATSDGYISMLAYTDKQWANFWRLADMPQQLEDPRFKTIRSRTDNIDVLYALAAKIIQGNSCKHWLDMLAKAEIPSGPINTFADLTEDPHLNALNFFRPYHHPTEGDLNVMDVGVKFDRQSLPIRRHQPGLGEHSKEVFEQLGLSQAMVDELLQDVE